MLRDELDRVLGEWFKATPTGLTALTEGATPVDPEAMGRVLAFRDVILSAAEEIERIMPPPER